VSKFDNSNVSPSCTWPWMTPATASIDFLVHRRNIYKNILKTCRNQ
jgi:hypothetical protein